MSPPRPEPISRSFVYNGKTFSPRCILPSIKYSLSRSPSPFLPFLRLSFHFSSFTASFRSLRACQPRLDLYPKQKADEDEESYSVMMIQTQDCLPLSSLPREMPRPAHQYWSKSGLLDKSYSLIAVAYSTATHPVPKARRGRRWSGNRSNCGHLASLPPIRDSDDRRGKCLYSQSEPSREKEKVRCWWRRMRKGTAQGVVDR